MRIGVAADHAGFRYKTLVAEHLRRLGHQVRDFGTNSEEPVDYPDFIRPCALAVAQGQLERGIIFGGSGNGEAMAANRIRGVRCAVSWDEESARLSRAHNDANILSLGQRLVPEQHVLAIVDVWLSTPFEAGRHVAGSRSSTSLSGERRCRQKRGSSRPGLSLLGFCFLSSSRARSGIQGLTRPDALFPGQSIFSCFSGARRWSGVF